MIEGVEVAPESVADADRKPVYLPRALHGRLKCYAETEGRTLTWIVARAIEEYLGRMETSVEAEK